jgi:hypothetical protein
VPRLGKRRAVPCDAHGDRCRLGGGSSYLSAFCSPAPPPEPDDPELAELVAEKRAAADGITVGEAAELVAAEADAERVRWSRLTCRQVDVELAVRWHGQPTRAAGEAAELAEVLREAQARAVTERAETAERRAAEEAAREPVATPASREPEPPSAGVATQPPADVVNLSAARRRRRPRVSITSISTTYL